MKTETKPKIKVGDKFITSTPSLLESTEVISIDKASGIATLKNQVKINSLCVAINSKCQVEPFDEDTYRVREAKFRLPGKIRKLSDLISKINDENCLLICKYTNKILNQLQ